MDKPFVYRQFETKVVFGPGSFGSIKREVQALKAGRALVLCTPEQRSEASRVEAQLGELSVGSFDGAVMHVPRESVDAAKERVAALGADVLVAIGGGSTLGLAKALALELPLPIVAVPTTYAGSEMTPIYGITEGARKRTGRDPRVLPKTVIYDPELTYSLPMGMSVSSGLNAMAHAAEALYAPDTNPIVALMAQESMRALAQGLRALVQGSEPGKARSDCLYGAWLAGCALGTVQMGLHHKLCHALGGMLNLPHAQTHAVVLPYALDYNASAIRPSLERMAAALGSSHWECVPSDVAKLAAELGAPASLAELGMRADQIEPVVAELMRNEGYVNPVPLEAAKLRHLLTRALAGTP